MRYFSKRNNSSDNHHKKTLSNEEQYKLLQKSQAKLLGLPLYQHKMQQVVSKFVQKGFIPRSKQDDIFQDINMAFLTKKMDNIRRNYQPKAGLLITYFEQAVYNTCMDVVRQNKKQLEHHTTDFDHIEDDYQANDPEQQMIEEELYKELVEIYRSPETLIQRTKVKKDQ